MFHRFETVGFQRVAGGDQIDNGIRQADQRCKLHRAVQLDNIHMNAFGGKVFRRNIGVFGGDAQAAAGL